MKLPIIKWLAIAATLTGTAIAQSAPDAPASDNIRSTTQQKSKIVIRTSDGKNQEEIILGGEGQDSKQLWKQIEEQIEEHQLDEKTLNVVREAFERAGKSVEGQIKSSAIILDDKGKRHHVELHNQAFPDWIGSVNQTQAHFDSVWPHVAKALKRLEVSQETIKRARSLAESYANPNKRHMIGVQCRQLDPLLSSQLLLDHGIVVERVFPDTPAEKAGVEKHDILLKANGESLGDVKDLIDTVQTAGIEDEEVTLTLLRAGEEQKRSMKTQPQLHNDPYKFHGDFFPQNVIPQSPRVAIPQNFPNSPHSLYTRDREIENLEETVESLQHTIEDLKREIEEASKGKKN